MRIGHAFSHKNKGLFHFGLLNCTRGLDSWTVPWRSATCVASKTRGCFGLDLWTVPEDWTRGPSLMGRPLWNGHAESLKNREVLQIGQNFFCLVFLQSAIICTCQESHCLTHMEFVMVSVLLLPSVKRVGVSRVRKFFLLNFINHYPDFIWQPS